MAMSLKDCCLCLNVQLKIKDIVYLENEKRLDFEKDAKSVRFDVYVEGSNKVFDIQM